MERVLRFDTRDASVPAIRAAAYRFGDRFSVAVDAAPPEGVEVSVRCIFIDSTSDEDADVTVAAFLRELNDQILRERVREETRAIRAAILAHTFSRTTLGRDG